jgi:MFS family permease
MSEIPPFLLDALQFQNARREILRKVPDAEWERVLSDWNVVRLTLPLREVCGAEVPAWVCERIDIFLADNALRFERIKSAYSRAADALREAGVDHVVIKGFSLWPGYTDHPKYRPQSDIDLYCPANAIFRARAAFFALGYSTQPQWRQVSTEHLSALIPPHSWKWRGNHFDPCIPISFELHFSLWDSATRHIYPHGLREFWSRREHRVLDDLCFPAFEPVDNLGYTALNLLRNFLSSSPAVEQVYGLARFLHTHAHDRSFWQRWRDLHHDSLKRLEAVSFQLASECFGCCLSEEAREEVDRLPSVIHQFFRHFSQSTISTRFARARCGLWLHLDLLESWSDRFAILIQQVVPARFAALHQALGDEAVVENPPNKNHSSRISQSTRKCVEYAKWFVVRGSYHLALLPVRLLSGSYYLLSRKNLGRQFWTFFAASFCFDLGMTMYFFLYNLYLLDCGFKENFLGLMMSAMNIGSIACTIPAGVLIQRLGIRKSLLICIVMVSAISATRALFLPRSAVLALALLGGFLTTIWAVAISPAIALLTNEKSRPFGFSLVFSSGIGVGILANLAASRLPGLSMRLSPAISEIRGKQVVLLIASAIVALGLVPLSMLQIEAPPSSAGKLYPRNPFLWRFLPAVALWSLVTGSLSPLANVYFSQYLHTPLARIGIIFSCSNLLQVLGILVAPFLFRRLGLVPGVACTQLAAALLLGFLAANSAAFPAALIYVGFTGFLWMSEPGLFSLLMSGVAPDERAGASSMNFLVISLVQAVAVAATGASFTRFGYPTVLGTIALVALLAALAFWGLLGRKLKTKPASIALDG